MRPSTPAASGPTPRSLRHRRAAPRARPWSRRAPAARRRRRRRRGAVRAGNGSRTQSSQPRRRASAARFVGTQRSLLASVGFDATTRGDRSTSELMPSPGKPIDELDARLLRALDEAPRVGVLELSRRLRVARATVQARLDRLVGRGVISSFAPTLAPEALGFGVTAFATLEIRQGRGAQVLDHLREIPEVLEVHTITGQGDMLCRLVARSNGDLQAV